MTGIWIPDETQPNDTPELNGMALTPLPGITDTGTSCSYIPNRYYSLIINMLLKDVSDAKTGEDGFIRFPCNN